MRTRLLVALGLAGALVAAVLVRTGCPSPDGVVDRWYAQTAAAAAGRGDVAATRTWSLAWRAADDVLAPRPGALRPRGEVHDRVAGAVAAVLTALAPDRRDAVQAALREGCSGGDGVRSGRASARRVLQDAAGDGLAQPDGPPPALPPGPGRWRPTPPGSAPYGGAGLARTPAAARLAPLLRRVPPPAALRTERYRRDLDEVRRLGAVDSRERTAQQSATARYWAASSVEVYTDVVREVLAPLGTRDAVRLLARFHRVALDVQVAVGAAKAADPRWRPVTALREDGDGDPLTPRVPGWTPLVETPPNPEHPSGHTAYAAAAAVVLGDEVGDRRVTARGRTWTAWEQLVRENEDARVWGGVHLRSSDEAGSALGRAVAAAT